MQTSHGRLGRNITLNLLILPFVATVGCNFGPGGPETVPVTGTVTFEGATVDGALVLFHPTQKGAGVTTGSAETDASGAFTMQTRIKGNDFKDGLQAASYQVTVEKMDHSHREKNPHSPPKNMLPEKYRDPKASGLTAEVTADGENKFDFALE